MIKENGNIVKCPKCKKEDVISVENFDYVKECQNDNCEYYVNHPDKWRFQFTTGIHN